MVLGVIERGKKNYYFASKMYNLSNNLVEDYNNLLKFVLTIFIPTVIIIINYFIGIAFVKRIFSYPINKLINIFLIVTFIRIVVISLASILIYKSGYVYSILFFLCLFILFFVFKIIEVLKINKMKK